LLNGRRGLRAAVLATVGILIGAQHPAAQDKVTCNMAWPPQGSSIGIMVAEERRFFKEASLDVNIIGGYCGNRPAKELDHGLFIRARRLDQHAAELQERREDSVYRRNQYALTCGDLLHQRGAPAGDSRFSKIT
jgi:hypothetical protein